MTIWCTFLGLLTLLPTAAGSDALLVYSDESPRVFLGCLNCSKYDSSSVWNQYGDYGSAYSVTSMHNRFGLYGGKYSALSPCNAYTSMPPLVVDRDGNYYGRLTANRYRTDRFGSSVKVLAAICEE